MPNLHPEILEKVIPAEFLPGVPDSCAQTTQEFPGIGNLALQRLTVSTQFSLQEWTLFGTVHGGTPNMPVYGYALDADQIYGTSTLGEDRD